MYNINDIKHFCREIEEAYYAGSEIPTDYLSCIHEWLRLNENEEHNIKDWKREYEDLKSAYEFLENKYAYLDCECERLKCDNDILTSDNNDLIDVYKKLIHSLSEQWIMYTDMTKSFINSLIQTNTLAFSQKTYLMYDDITQKFKIGKSYDPYKREKTLCSDRCSIYLVAYCDYDIESVLHSMYSEYRARGEWFNLSTNQVNYIIDYFGMKITNQTKLNEFYERDILPF